MRTLVLLRHAKSDYPPGVPDIDRPLSLRGVRDATAAGIWLKAAFPSIDEVRVSPALRARQTWSFVSEHVAASSVRDEPLIYSDWGERLPDVIRSIDPEARTALIVGHNPGIESLAMAMCRDANFAACARMARKYPTCGVTLVNFPGEWSGQSAAEVVAFAVPRGSA